VIKNASDDDEDPSIEESSGMNTDLRKYIAQVSEFQEACKSAYSNDKLFAKIQEKPSDHKLFMEKDGLIYTRNASEAEVLCIPKGMLNKRSLIEIVIDQAHVIVGHFGFQRTSDYIRRWYWWPSMNTDIHAFCDSCGVCQETKTSNQKPMGLLHSMPIPT
jgi:hypothetical protein